MLCVPFDHWREEYLTDLAQRCHCLRRSTGLHRPGSRGDRLDVRLMAPNDLYGNRTVCQSHNSVYTLPAAVSVELGVWNAMGGRLPTSECPKSLVHV